MRRSGQPCWSTALPFSVINSTPSNSLHASTGLVILCVRASGPLVPASGVIFLRVSLPAPQILSAAGYHHPAIAITASDRPTRAQPSPTVTPTGSAGAYKQLSGVVASVRLLARNHPRFRHVEGRGSARCPSVERHTALWRTRRPAILTLAPSHW